MVPLVVSMTGVGVMPTSGRMNGHWTSRDGTGVALAIPSERLTCQSGAPADETSKAYTELCSVATKINPCFPLLGIDTEGR